MELSQKPPKTKRQPGQPAETDGESPGRDFGSVLSDVLVVAADVAGEMIDRAADVAGEVDA